MRCAGQRRPRGCGGAGRLRSAAPGCRAGQSGARGAACGALPGPAAVLAALPAGPPRAGPVVVAAAPSLSAVADVSFRCRGVQS